MSQSNSDFSFIVIADHHLRESEALLNRGYSTAHAFRAVMRHIAEHAASRADFIVTLGDLVDAGTDAEYQHVRGMLGIREVSAAPGPQRVNLEGLRELPMYFLPGNHDRRAQFLANMFPLGEPCELMNVAFTHGGVQFLCLDWGAQNQAIAYPETLEFLARALHSGAPSVLLTHHHVARVGVGWLDAFLADDVEKFWETIAGRNVLGIFCGHIHATYEKRISDIPVFGTRATCFQFALQEDKLFCLQPPHYRVVTLRDGKLTTAIYEVNL